MKRCLYVSVKRNILVSVTPAFSAVGRTRLAYVRAMLFRTGHANMCKWRKKSKTDKNISLFCSADQTFTIAGMFNCYVQLQGCLTRSHRMFWWNCRIFGFSRKQNIQLAEDSVKIPTFQLNILFSVENAEYSVSSEYQDTVNFTESFCPKTSAKTVPKEDSVIR